MRGPDEGSYYTDQSQPVSGVGYSVPPRSPGESPALKMPSFTCLAVETATEVASVALEHNGVCIDRRARGMAAPSRAIYGWITELMAEAGLDLGALHCVAFGAGPGGFTGVRVATAVAQALAFARNLPVCPVSTLAAMAAGALRSGSMQTVACCQDARMGQVYFAVYRRDPQMGVVAVRQDALLDPAEIRLDEWSSLTAVGSGWSAYPELAVHLTGRGRFMELADLPSARDVAALAGPLFRSGRIVRPEHALPNYLRDQVASLPGRNA